MFAHQIGHLSFIFQEWIYDKIVIMVYIDNLDGYEEVYDELEEIPTTTDFIYYDAGKLARFIFSLV